MRSNFANCEYIEWQDCLQAHHYCCVADIKEHLMPSQWEKLAAWHVSHDNIYTLTIHEEDIMAADMVTVSVKESDYWYLPGPNVAFILFTISGIGILQAHDYWRA